jgi:hypothetical protein
MKKILSTIKTGIAQIITINLTITTTDETGLQQSNGFG